MSNGAAKQKIPRPVQPEIAAVDPELAETEPPVSELVQDLAGRVQQPQLQVILVLRRVGVPKFVGLPGIAERDSPVSGGFAARNGWLVIVLTTLPPSRMSPRSVYCLSGSSDDDGRVGRDLPLPDRRVDLHVVDAFGLAARRRDTRRRTGRGSRASRWPLTRIDSSCFWPGWHNSPRSTLPPRGLISPARLPST